MFTQTEQERQADEGRRYGRFYRDNRNAGESGQSRSCM